MSLVSNERFRQVRIVKVEDIKLSRPHDARAGWATNNFRSVKADAQLLKLTSSEGHIGIGEICPYGGPNMVSSWISWYSKAILNRSISDAWNFLRPRGTNWAHDGAVAGFDCAIWDLVGQIEGKSVASLLGASEDTKYVDAYASGGVSYDWEKNPEQVIEEVVAYKALGFSTAKIRLGTAWKFSNITPNIFISLMKKLRNEVGDKFNLALDGNARLSLEEAIPVASGINDLGFSWFEDALPLNQIKGFIELQKAAPNLIISGGEQMQSLDQYKPFFESGALQMIHPDAGWMGISEMKVVMEMAATYGVSADPHGWHNGALAIAHAHIMASAPLYGQVEINFSQGPLREGILKNGLNLKAGKLEVPQGPGLGIELADDLETKFPYIDHDYLSEIVRPLSEESFELRNYK